MQPLRAPLVRAPARNTQFARPRTVVRGVAATAASGRHATHTQRRTTAPVNRSPSAIWQVCGGGKRWECHRQSLTSCCNRPSSPHHQHQMLPAGTPPPAYQGHQLCQAHAFAYQPACRHHLHQNPAALHIANNRVQNWPSKVRLAGSATGAKPMPHALPVILCHRAPLCNICIKAPSHSPFLGAAPVTASTRP